MSPMAHVGCGQGANGNYLHMPERNVSIIAATSDDNTDLTEEGDTMNGFNGLGMHLGTLARLSDAKTRSISPENFSGEAGGGARATEGTGAAAARSPGQGWKVALADIAGQGAIQHIWATVRNARWRLLILRMYWDDQEFASVECPIGDFFANGWESYAPVNSAAVCVNPG